jgi:hypothetical protein
LAHTAGVNSLIWAILASRQPGEQIFQVIKRMDTMPPTTALETPSTVKFDMITFAKGAGLIELMNF